MRLTDAQVQTHRYTPTMACLPCACPTSAPQTQRTQLEADVAARTAELDETRQQLTVLQVSSRAHDGRGYHRMGRLSTFSFVPP